ncbi:CHAP domain-containing protein [Haloplasma contractile]|uniref:CHAP domain protein n=1 Tax=Haloplasma contractile SSD-17B TaxID=1033810 RepID=F7PW03_9MOLU|nr:CHAP domain-containing protein [Haloplasma contractile]ERJ12673.1 CHAP domain protein [Haloplasma contractile SSD-17B]
MKTDQMKRQRMAEIAHYETLQGYEGNEFKGGNQIEKYLADFRKAFIELENKEQDWHNVEIGFDWCGAFVCWCAREAGFKLPIIKPIAIGGSLASVPIWYHYANSEECNFFYSAKDEHFHPEAGDLVLYNHVFSGRDLDHIGVVIKVDDDYLITAEGNEDNRAQLLRRKRDHHINGYVRLQNL